MPSRLSPLVVAAVSAAAADDYDDDDHGGGGDSDDNYDDDYDDTFVGLTHYTCSTRSPVNGQNFDRRLLSTILDSGTRPYMPGKRATSRVKRAIMLLTALKPDRMGAERARLLNKEQRYPFCPHSLTHSEIRDQISCVINTHHKLNGKNPSRYLRVPSFERDRPPGGPPLVTPQLNGGPARRAVNNLIHEPRLKKRKLCLVFAAPINTSGVPNIFRCLNNTHFQHFFNMRWLLSLVLVAMTAKEAPCFVMRYQRVRDAARASDLC